jgi:hypothetical protein
VSQHQLFGTPQTEMTSDDYFTPPEIFERLGVGFDVDVCAPPGGVPWIPAKTYLTQADDGLTTDWVGNVWLNPPFSQPKLWVEKWLKHENGVLLAPTAKSKWFNKLWDSNAKLLLLPANLKFVDPKGSNGSIMLACVLAALGETNIKAVSNFGKIR